MPTGRVIDQANVNENTVTVYGHHHTPENVRNEEDDIQRLMEEHDRFAAEGFAPLDPDISVGDHESVDDDAYAAALLEIADGRYDEIWAPDRYNGFYHNIGFLTVPLILKANILYDMSKDMVEAAKGDAEGLKSSNLASMNRRKFLSGGLMAVLGGISGLPEAVAGSRDITRDYDNDIYPLFISYMDAREAITAEGLHHIADEYDEDVLYISGAAHAHSIAGYTDNDRVRSAKVDAYSEVLPDWQTSMIRWAEEGDVLVVDNIVNLDYE